MKKLYISTAIILAFILIGYFLLGLRSHSGFSYIGIRIPLYPSPTDQNYNVNLNITLGRTDISGRDLLCVGARSKRQEYEHIFRVCSGMSVHINAWRDQNPF